MKKAAPWHRALKKMGSPLKLSVKPPRAKNVNVINETPQKLIIALVKFFAGLRSAHVAVNAMEGIEIVYAHAAECCDSANKLVQEQQQQHKIKGVAGC